MSFLPDKSYRPRKPSRLNYSRLPPSSEEHSSPGNHPSTEHHSPPEHHKETEHHPEKNENPPTEHHPQQRVLETSVGDLDGAAAMLDLAHRASRPHASSSSHPPSTEHYEGAEALALLSIEAPTVPASLSQGEARSIPIADDPKRKRDTDSDDSAATRQLKQRKVDEEEPTESFASEQRPYATSEMSSRTSNSDTREAASDLRAQSVSTEASIVSTGEATKVAERDYSKDKEDDEDEDDGNRIKALDEEKKPQMGVAMDQAWTRLLATKTTKRETPEYKALKSSMEELTKRNPDYPKYFEPPKPGEGTPEKDRRKYYACEYCHRNWEIECEEIKLKKYRPVRPCDRTVPRWATVCYPCACACYRGEHADAKVA